MHVTIYRPTSHSRSDSAERHRQTRQSHVKASNWHEKTIIIMTTKRYHGYQSMVMGGGHDDGIQGYLLSDSMHGIVKITYFSYR